MSDKKFLSLVFYVVGVALIVMSALNAVCALVDTRPLFITLHYIACAVDMVAASASVVLSFNLKGR